MGREDVDEERERETGRGRVVEHRPALKAKVKRNLLTELALRIGDLLVATTAVLAAKEEETRERE